MKSSRTASELVMPILSAGRHKNPRRGACFMEFASYLAGEKWSDHPACTHPVLAALARDVNDLSSPTARAGLTGYIHRVVGLTSVDPLVTAAIAVHAAAAALPIASLERQRAIAVGMLMALDTIDSPELESIAAQALSAAPNEERWARTYRATIRSRRFTAHTAITLVHTSVVGIAHACVPDANERLAQLLIGAVELVEYLTGSPAASAPGSEQADTTLRGQFAEV